jgi:hypothetical protein
MLTPEDIKHAHAAHLQDRHEQLTKQLALQQQEVQHHVARYSALGLALHEIPGLRRLLELVKSVKFALDTTTLELARR